MAEDTKAPAAAPASAQVVAPAPVQTAAVGAPQSTDPQPTAPANKVVERKTSSPIISNPVPAQPAVVVEKPPAELPSTTIAEMAAGKAALEKNRPVAEALEAELRKREAVDKA